MSQDTGKTEATAPISAFGYSVTRLTFSDGESVSLPDSGVVVIVGPNNAGKSQALQDVAVHVGAENPTDSCVAVTGIVERRTGSGEQFYSWLRSRYTHGAQPHSFGGVGFSIGVQAGQAKSLQTNAIAYWEQQPRLETYGRAVAALLTTGRRLTGADSQPAFDAANAHPNSAVQTLYLDRERERSVSAAFRSAFGEDLAVGRLGGSKIHLHVGRAPSAAQHGGELTVSYANAVNALPQMERQGDGMRSYAACLLYSDVSPFPVLLIDEPETFIHPAQARMLARHLATATSCHKRQLFVSTHSSEVVRGLLDAAEDDVTVIRLTRDGNKNIPQPIDSKAVKALWRDPLLRVSNILDGLFHEHVCLCEADTDVRFYGMMVEALYQGSSAAHPDLMFCHCGGKDRMPVVVRALAAVGIAVTVIADLDVLDGDTPLRDLWVALGGDWEEIERDWKIVHDAVKGMGRAPKVQDARDKVIAILDGESGDSLSQDGFKRVREATKTERGWTLVKKGGEASVPKGDARGALDRLRVKLQERGLFVVPVGELEGWLPTVGGHGPAWVNKVVVEHDLAKEPMLDAARKFVRELPFVDATESPATQSDP